MLHLRGYGCFASASQHPQHQPLSWEYPGRLEMLGAFPNPMTPDPPGNVMSFSFAARSWEQTFPLGMGWEVSAEGETPPGQAGSARVCALGQSDLEASLAKAGKGERGKEEGGGRKKPHLT